MKRELSLYLDVVRFVAALTVFVSHFAQHHISGGLLWQLNPLGHEAVTVFFVLSGYVIAHATATRETDARDYVLSRCARLYSVAAPAVLLTVVLDLLGSHFHPAAYAAEWGYSADFSAWRFVSALTFTNELWGLSVRQGSNAAYWSMGYEAPFYVIFGLALYAPRRWRHAAVAAALLAVGPSIAVALPLWLAGVAAYRYNQRRPLSPRTGLVLFALSCLGWLAYEITVLRTGRPVLQPTALFKRAELIQDAVIGALFIANLVGFDAAAPTLGRALLRHANTIRWLAGATFTLYLCHLPVAQFLAALSPWPITDGRSHVLVLVGTVLAVFVLAEFTERRKADWRRWLDVAWPMRRAAPGSP